MSERPELELIVSPPRKPEPPDENLPRLLSYAYLADYLDVTFATVEKRYGKQPIGEIWFLVAELVRKVVTTNFQAHMEGDSPRPEPKPKAKRRRRTPPGK